MIHVFRLGPMAASGGASTYTYVGVSEGGEPRVREAPSDELGIGSLAGEALGQPLSLEPALAEVAQRLGHTSGLLPPEVLKLRAIVAFELASGIQQGASRRDAVAAFLEGAAAFWSARSWEVVAPEERLAVAFLEGHGEVDGELSVVGGDGMRHPGVALCDARAALEELARLEGDARAEAALRLANLTVDMERDPAWATEALEEGLGLPRVPAVTRNRGGPAPVVTQDLVVAAALLQAIAAFTRLEEEGGVAEGLAQAAGMKVTARVRPSGQLPARPVEGLTPVSAAPGPAPTAAPEPKAAPPPAVPRAEPGPVEPAEPQPQPTPASPSAAGPQLTPAPSPEEPKLAPLASATAAAPATQAPSASPAPAAGEPPSPAGREGWLARALRSLRRGGSGAPAAAPAHLAPRAPPRPARSAPAARPRPSAPPPPSGPAAVEGDPFAPFAQALRLELPSPPPPPPPGDEAALAELAAHLVEGAGAAAALVSFPAIALQIVERVHDPKADARGVAGFVSRDPALSADVVSVANSAAFRGVSEIESVHDAVARLGLAEVGRVASAVAARKVLAPGKGADPAAAELFIRAVAVATAASSAALRQRGARTDHVWLGGLLHDVGRALARQLLAQVSSGPGAHLTPVALTHQVVERVHVQVGVAAIRRWALPAYLLEMCAHHHDEAIPAEQVDLHLVRLVSALASLGDPLTAARSARELVQSAAALQLGPPAVRALATELKAADARARTLAG
ncbi:MAG: HDOD domain-containing protein [Anaeromyxobacter sp.]